MSRQLLHALRCGAVAWALFTAPAYAHRRHPSNPPPAEGLGLSLAGPCAAFSWHNPDEHRVTVLDLGPMGFTARPGLGLQRETAGVCPTASPWSLGVGATYGPQIAMERADYFVAGSYQVQRGAWRIAALAGVIYEPILTRPHRLYTTIHTGSWFPFFMVTVRVRW